MPHQVFMGCGDVHVHSRSSTHKSHGAVGALQAEWLKSLQTSRSTCGIDATFSRCTSPCWRVSYTINYCPMSFGTSVYNKGLFCTLYSVL
ncbi:hypothetical protein GDO78_022492 [Eleutherodactylus coqui]|uniref:Uncharacterized protein n=1 Tax=Eleutherodactylus coqui TaxID=57060 RepID=A0A8J6EFZ5_ELECQ|nr:hypothetical protein GDO78_022492 [Eleutherodactylus coqui]